MTTHGEHISQSTVLCVDDDPNVLSALKRVLHRFGCRVLLANCGGDALDILGREHVNVLICDEAMPGLCGTEVLRRAKAISPETARVLLTGHCSDQSVVIPAVNESQVFRLLSKPWEDSDIQRVIVEALGMTPEEWRQTKERVQGRLRSV